jgi:hypothetical protein
MLSFGLNNTNFDSVPLSMGEAYPVYDDAILRRARASGATTYRPPSNAPARQVATSPTLSFPGVASVPQSRNTVVPLSYGKSVPSGGGALSSLSNFLSTFSMGSPVGAQTAYDTRHPVNVANTQQRTVGSVDGSTNWIDRLKSVSSQVQDLIGSSGDASSTPQQVAYQEGPTGPNWLVIGGVVALAGAAYYVYTR